MQPGPAVVVEDREPGVRWITLNRPERRNAIDRAVFAGLLDAFAALDRDDDVRVAVLTGAGPGFCGGVDLADAADAELVAERRRTGINPPTALLGVRTPVIGAINGACVTGGLELALACDLLIASDRARFADTHVALGVLPAWGGTALLPATVGRRRATELALTGRVVDAAEAERIGLVSRVVPHDRLASAAATTARAIADADPAVVGRLLRVYADAEGRNLAGRLAVERRAVLAAPVRTDGMAERRATLGRGAGDPSD